MTEAETIETGTSEWNPDGLMEEKRDEYAETAYTDMKEADRQQAEAYLAEKGVQVPDSIRNICLRKGPEYGISPYMLMAICFKESRFNVNAQNGPCKGLCQVNVNYYPHNWQDPEANIDAACRCIRGIIDTWGFEDLGDIMSYYHGEGRTGYSGYTKDIADIAEALERADGK